MTIQYFKNLRELNRFLKTTPIDLPLSRLNEIRTRAKKKKDASFMVWINPSGRVIDLSLRVQSRQWALRGNSEGLMRHQHLS